MNRGGYYRHHVYCSGFRYRETDPSGIVENEICPVFAAQIITPLNINAEEVMAYQWVELDALCHSLVATPWAFSPWMVLEAETQTRNSESLPPASQ
jgi:isopentenyl-diphosphate delta-isomerase